MTERERFLMRMAVIYLISNRDDANEAFVDDDEETEIIPDISVSGDIGKGATEEELANLLNTLQ